MVDTPVAGATLSPNVSLSLPEIYALLIKNGASAAEALNLTAITTREDPGGTINIVNDNPDTGDYSVGLFQFNFLDVNGNRMATRDGYTPVQLANDVNAQIKSALDLWRASVKNGLPGSDWMPHQGGVALPWNTNVRMDLAVGAVAQVGGNIDSWVASATQKIESGGGDPNSSGNPISQAGQAALQKIIQSGQDALATIQQNIGSSQLDTGFLTGAANQLTTDIEADKQWIQQYVQNGTISQSAADAIIGLIQQAVAANPNISTEQIQEFLQGVISDPGSIIQRLQDLGNGPGGVVITTLDPGLGAVASGGQAAATAVGNVWKAATDPLGALNAISKAITNLSDLGTNVSDEINKIKSGNFSDLSGAAVLIIGMSIIGIGGLLLLAEASGSSQVQTAVRTGAKVAAL